MYVRVIEGKGHELYLNSKGKKLLQQETQMFQQNYNFISPPMRAYLSFYALCAIYLDTFSLLAHSLLSQEALVLNLNELICLFFFLVSVCLNVQGRLGKRLSCLNYAT